MQAAVAAAAALTTVAKRRLHSAADTLFCYRPSMSQRKVTFPRFCSLVFVMSDTQLQAVEFHRSNHAPKLVGGISL